MGWVNAWVWLALRRIDGACVAHPRGDRGDVPQLGAARISQRLVAAPALKPRSTGQGGIVYYFLNQAGQGFLLPMRVAGFARLVRHVQAKTGIDTTDVKPLSQPWMYLILLGFTLLLLLIDGWTIWTVNTQGIGLG